jgi:hypothetical protein
VLREHAKRLFYERFHANLYQQRTKTDAVADMLTVWELLGVSMIDSSWDISLEATKKQ